MAEKETVNDRVANWVSNFVGNMWFFWGSLAFILLLRVLHPPSGSQFLLDLENDLQFLLLATNAVVNAKQLTLLMEVLGEIRAKAEHIEAGVVEIGEAVPKRNDAA
jgi:uncharacterized membrane protein